MLQKKLFLISFLITHYCFSMDERRLLATDALPLHSFLTMHGNNNDIDESVLSNFINAFKSSRSPVAQLCDLPDKRNWFSSYKYTCPVEQQFEIESYHPHTGYTYLALNGGSDGAIMGVPLLLSITKNGNKRRIALVDTHHTWASFLYTDNRTYNLIRLLFDCDRVNEAQRILSAVDQKLTIHPHIKTAFQEMYERISQDMNIHKKKTRNLQELRSLFAKNENSNGGNYYATASQGLLLLGMLVVKKERGFFSARNVRVVSALSIAGLEWVKQRVWGRQNKIKND